MSNGSTLRSSASLGAAIRHARAGRLTVAQLAERSGTSKGLISLIERGHGNPSFETLRRIAGALDVPLVQLVEAADPAGEAGADAGAGRAMAGVIVRSVDPVDPSVATFADPRVGESDSLGWQTSMMLVKGQEARIRVLDGSLELGLRDGARIAPGKGNSRELALDLEVRAVGEPSPVVIPPVSDPRWLQIADGSEGFSPTTLGARMLLTHVTRCVRDDRSSPNVERWISELRGYFVKYETVSQDDLNRMFG